MELKFQTSSIKSLKCFFNFGNWNLFVICYLVLGISLGLLLITQNSFALTRQIPLSGQLLTPGKLAVPDGDYTMRFAIYNKDRTVSDPYPSDADSASRIWTETQTVKVERGLWKVVLGSATALPATLNFETGTYFLGIRINTDSEMTPRKKILPVPLAVNSESVGGAKPGTGNNNILQLDSAGAINIAGNITTAGILQGANLIVGTAIQLPANSIFTADIMDGTISTVDLADGSITTVKLSDGSVTSGKIADGAITSLDLADGSITTAKLADLAVTTAKIADASITSAKLATGDLHFQNTDTGTTSLSFGLGTGTAIGTNNFSITASNASNKPAVRYNGTTGKWQISNDGTTFADIGSSLSSSLQAAYDAGNTITTTDARNLIFNLADTATDSSFLVNLQGTGNTFQVQDAGTPIFTVADGGLATFGGNIDLSGNRITNASRIDGNASGSFLYTAVDVRQVYTIGTSLSLDSSNYPHILYYTSDNSAAVIADWNGSQWTITDFDTVGTRGRNNDLVIDGAGVKHAAYQEEITNDSDLIYAKFVGSGGNCSGSAAWDCTIVDSTGDVGTNSNSIDVDGSNIPHISYYDNTNGNLKHAWFVGSGGNCSGSAAWNCEIVESANNVGSASSIAINKANGNIHISYYDTTNGDLRYVKYSGGAWGTPVNLDGSAGCIAAGCGTRNAGNYSTGSNLALNAFGNPRVSYSDYSNDDLYYAYSNDGGATWTTTKIDGGSGVTGTGCATSGNYGQYSSLAIDSSGSPHISYYNYSSNDLRYASNNGSSWTCQTLDSTNTIGLYTSIKLTSADKVYISYQDSTNVDLKLVSNNYPKLNIYGDLAIMGETGNLGIGVLQPTERLDVAGNVKATGNISTSQTVSGGYLSTSNYTYSPTVYGSSSSSGNLTLNSTNTTTKGNVYINPGGQKTVIGNSTASTGLATAGLQIAPNYLFIQYRYYNPGTGYTYSGNTGEANSYGGTPFTLVSAAGDMAYFGSYQPFNSLEVDLATSGVAGAVAWECWTGAAWASVAGLSDSTSNLTQDGIVSWTTTLGSTSVNGYTAYWIRANVTTTAYTTAPTANSTIIGQFGSSSAPLVASLIQPAGIADSTSWSATGTMLGINTPSGFNGNFVDLQVNGTSKFVVTSAGNVGIGTGTPGEKLEVVGNIISSGTAWTSRTSAADNDWHSVTYGNGLFVAVADTGIGNRVMTSPDGINWTLRTSAADNGWRDIIYGNGLFVVVAISGTGNRVMTSPDGINWTTRNSAADNDWRDVAYGNGLFVAVADTGIGNRVMTSPDGVNWTLRTSAADNSWYGVTYGNGLFVAVSGSGTVMTSPDGINWTIRTSAASNAWADVAYGNGLFVAVSYTGAGNRIMTSPDGVTWTSRTNPADNEWRGVIYGNGLFVAVADTGTGNRVMTSPDGINWTLRTSAADNGWRNVAYGNGIFVAVAISGTGNRVMTSGKSELNLIAHNNIYQGGMSIMGGNVGINTTSASGNLDIRQIADGNQVIYARRNTDTTPTGNFIQFQNAAGTSTLFSVNINGVATTSYMMVGTANSSYRFDAAYSGSGVIDVARIHNDTSAANNSGAQFLFGANRTTSGMTNIAGVAGLITDITQTAYKGALIFSTADNAAPVERARIDNAGNVSFGVNVTSGTTTVDLGGTGTANAVCHTTQTGTDNEGLVDCTSGPIADYAEMYPVASGVEYGDIVAVGTKMLETKDGDNIVQLVKSSAPYQSTTIGIVSNNYGDFTSAGYNIRKEDNPMPVALNGRVPVKVSLENGPIEAGDFLTSSSTPGVAMKATGAGYIIGKALEPFTELPTTNYSLPTKIFVFVNPGWYTPLTGPLVQGSNNQFDTINVGGLATTKDLIVTGLAIIKGDLIVEGKVKGDLEVEGIVKAKGIVGGWRSYENHFLSSKFENDFTVSLLASEKSAASWEYHKVKLATDALAGSKAQLDHSFNFKPADDENGATWRFIVKAGEGAEFRFGIYGDEQNYALIQNGTEPQTLKFISCAIGECTTTDNIPVDPSAANRNYVVMIKQGEAKLLIDGQEYANNITNVPADSILHFYENVTTNVDASQSIILDYLGVIIGKYEPF